MVIKLILAGLMLITVAPLSYAGSEPNMKEGKWEISATVEMQGMPGGAAPMTYTQCLTKQDAVPKSPASGTGCTIKNIKAKGNTVTWVMRCKEQGATIDGSGTITYSSDTMQGTIKMTLNDPEGGKMQMTQRLSGKRVGDCK